MTAQIPPQILARPDGATIAYNSITGKSPGVVFLSGFMSDMTGSKAMALEEHCKTRGQAFLRFDYSGHGQSSGVFAEGTIGQWAEDAIFAIEQLTEGPQVLVGSSMGGWIMLLAALRLQERVCALIGLAAAPDFTEDLIEGELTDQQRRNLTRDGFIEVPCDYDDGEPYTITQRLIDDGRNNLLLADDIMLNQPVRLIQGLKDSDVPWATALRLQEKLTSTDVEITLIKDGDHRLSEPDDLARLRAILDTLLDAL
ncbi:MAG: alpha/beta hydrolase [Rhodospirillaceae bacterium]|nr:alpha/beta hydrolase [Rhodospirillaceae bacterium]